MPISQIMLSGLKAHSYAQIDYCKYHWLITRYGMHRSNTYNLFTSPIDIPPLSPYKPHTARIKSLHKIKVSHKGLPKDFFSQHSIKNRSHRHSQHEKSRVHNQFEEIRTTPTFPAPLTVDARQQRQYKSEERVSKAGRSNKVVSSPLIEPEGLMTFSRQFFQERPEPKTIKLHIRRKTDLNQSELKEDVVVYSPMKTEIGQLMKRKKLDRQKYPFLLLQRSQAKHQNKLPSLKVRVQSGLNV